MSKIEEYREILKTVEDWDSYLLQESRLPGRRANIELARAVVDEGDEALFEGYISYNAQVAPPNTPKEFLAFCGVLGMGRLLAEGQTKRLATLRIAASDPRWRIREAVAMALQRLGKVDMETLISEMTRWAMGNSLEQRAAAAALCEPGLLSDKGQVLQVLQVLNTITASIKMVEDRKSPEFKALRKGLGYCWSVAVVAYPEQGKKFMGSWFESDDEDVRWIMKENLKKKRLVRMDPEWVSRWLAIVE